MAREKGTLIFPYNLQVKRGAALDPRTVVNTKAELYRKETWPYDDDIVYLYNGLTVSVIEDGGLYLLVDAANYDQENSWKNILNNGSAISRYTHNQTEAASTWEITHNLGYYPFVQLYDSNGEQFLTDIKYVNENTIQVIMNVETSGVAILI